MVERLKEYASRSECKFALQTSLIQYKGTKNISDDFVANWLSIVCQERVGGTYSSKFISCEREEHSIGREIENIGLWAWNHKRASV